MVNRAMMGDTGVAVNPEDERFKHLVGKTCILPIMNREIPIVADDYVELGFGTGSSVFTKNPCSSRSRTIALRHS